MSASEVAHHPDLGDQLVPCLPKHGFSSELYQVAYVAGGGAPEVDDDVGVLVEDRGPSTGMDLALQAAFVDEPAGPDALDFLKDRTGGWEELKVGMATLSPFEVLANDLP